MCGRSELDKCAQLAKWCPFVAAISDGAGDFSDVRAALKSVTAERDESKQALAEVESMPVVALHPQIAEQYRSMVRNITAAFASPHAQREAAPILRAMIDTIEIVPANAPKGVEIEVRGRLANMLAMASGKPVTHAPVTGAPTLERVAGIEPA